MTAAEKLKQSEIEPKLERNLWLVAQEGIKGITQVIIERRQRIASEQALAKLDDHLLKDIGIYREKSPYLSSSLWF